MLIRIATRRSPLALAQSRWIAARLEALAPEIRVELREYVTRGDRIQNVPLSQVGGKGLFTKEIEDALLSGEAEIAVHSLKDLPSELPPGLILGAVPAREDPRDVLVLPAGKAAVAPPPGTPAALPIPSGARVGSSSFRRSSQILFARPDVTVESVRGNVDTRLRKLDEGGYDALVLAAAGLRRLDLGHRISAHIPPEICTPAPGQGALGLECREADTATLGLLARIDDPDARLCVAAERSVLEALGGGCSIPLGAFARVHEGTLHLMAVVATPDGSRVIREEASEEDADPERLGRFLTERLLAAGARGILDAARG